MIAAKVKISGIQATVTEKTQITAGTVGAQVQLEYTDPVWEGLRKTMVFYGAQVKSLITDETLVTIPAEVIAKPNVTLVLGVYGVDSDGVTAIPTLLVELGTVRFGTSLTRDVSADPSLPVWAQMLTMIGDLQGLHTGARNNLVAAINEVLTAGGTVDGTAVEAMIQDALTQAKESGEFDGNPGADGVCPVIGVTAITGGHRITLTDAYGTQTLDVMDGADGSGDPVPGFVQAEADRVIQAALSHRSGNCLTFLAMADSHQLNTNADVTDGNRHAGQAAAYIADRLNLDFACFLGDATYGSSTTTLEEGKAEIMQTNAFLAAAFRGLPQLRTPGNHDPLTYSYTQNGGCLSPGVVSGLVGQYGFLDFPAQKVRVICLNTADLSGQTVTENGGAERVSPEQYRWLCESLDLSDKADAADWHILLLSHHPADWGNVYRVANILAAYEAGGTVTPYSGYTKDFSGKNGARLLGQLHGHTHCCRVDRIKKIENGTGTDTGIYRLAVPNMCFLRSNEYGTNTGAEYYGIEFGEDTTYAKTAGTAQDTAFYVVTVDLENRMLYADHYGAAADRSFSFAQGHTVTANLTNVTRSNLAASVAEGGSYTTTLTAEEGCTLDTVTVTMGGADVTEAVYSGGTITISNVTGDIVITATATQTITAYTVTSNLTHVTGSNAAASVTAGGSYTTTLTADSGYTLDTVTVTMGGTDVTSGVYSGGTVTISNVTGNIVITASASAPAAYTNLVSTAQAMDSEEVYNGTGYKNGYYISSESPFEGTDSTTVLTGYIAYPIPAEGAPGAIYIKGAAWSESNSHCRINWFRASKTEIVGPYIVGGSTAETKVLGNFFTLETLGDNYIKLTPILSSSGYTSMLVEKVANSAAAAFVRFSLQGTGENLIITVDEPIEG